MERNVKTYKQFINEDIIPGGIADHMKFGKFDRDELTRGINVELEHTDDKKIAREIAMDHLAEDPLYYKKLKDIHEDVRHEGDMWNVYVGRRLVGSYESRKEAREHNNKLKKTKTK